MTLSSAGHERAEVEGVTAGEDSDGAAVRVGELVYSEVLVRRIDIVSGPAEVGVAVLVGPLLTKTKGQRCLRLSAQVILYRVYMYLFPLASPDDLRRPTTKASARLVKITIKHATNAIQSFLV